MDENCSVYKLKLESLNKSLEFELKLSPKNDSPFQHKQIEVIQLGVENMKLLVEKHCTH